MAKKGGQKIRAWVDPPSPLIRAMPERKRFFSIDVFPYLEIAHFFYPATFLSELGPIIGFPFVASLLLGLD